jgi:hypothetical protein
MSEAEKTPEILAADFGFWSDINWELIKYNKISKEDFMRIRTENKKLYATFLGAEEELEFYLFTPLPWDLFKEIKQTELNKLATHDAIINKCLVWPKANSHDKVSAGVILTLVYQTLSMSNFLPDPTQALKMIIEV